jgi:hypothetical protein
VATVGDWRVHPAASASAIAHSDMTLNGTPFRISRAIVSGGTYEFIIVASRRNWTSAHRRASGDEDELPPALCHGARHPVRLLGDGPPRGCLGASLRHLDRRSPPADEA